MAEQRAAARLADRRIELRTGDIHAVLERGTLRWLSIGGREAIRGIYGAVRDPDWGTVEPRFTVYALTGTPDRFAVRFVADHRRDDIDFTWKGRIDGSPDAVRFAMAGRANTTFLTNRIGLCLLYPDTLAGSRITIGTRAGDLDGRLPAEIAPENPFTEIEAIELQLPGGAEILTRFNGGLFELEDQRNWTDASFKVFSPPSSTPTPRQVTPGTEVRQSIHVELRRARTRRRAAAKPASISVGPSVGHAPALGVCVSPADVAVSDDAVQRVRALGLSHLRAFVAAAQDPTGPTVRAQLLEAKALGLPVELEILTTPGCDGVEPLLRLVRELRVALARVLVFDIGTFVTAPGQAAGVRSIARDLGLSVQVGGGSCADFAELNQHRPPVHDLDVVGYRATPQIHAFDDATIMENLAGLRATVSAARRIAGERAIAVGPVTLRGLFNPVGTGPAPAARLPAADVADPRQATLFGAAWSLGSLAVLSGAGAAAITIHAVAGPAGLQPAVSGESALPRRGTSVPHVHPVYHVLADLLSAGVPLRRLELPGAHERPDLAVLAVERRQGIRVLLANLGPQPTTATLHMSEGATRLRMLDADSVADAVSAPDAFRRRGVSAAAGRSLTVELAPYAVARVDRRTTPGR